MGMDNATRLPGARQARALLLLGLAAEAWGIAVFYFGVPPGWATPTTYALPVFLVIALFLAVDLTRAGTANTPALAAALGVAFILGGATFDMVATVLHTPDLRQEDNPIARCLFEAGHSPRFVLTYALAAECLYLLGVCAVWVALLRHRHTLAASLRGSRGLLLFLKAATGGGERTWRQWLLPLRLSELPSAYHVFWFLVAALVACGADRWYLGFEWFGLVPQVRWLVAAVAVVLGLTWYFAWLWHASQEGAGGAAAGKPAPAGTSPTPASS